MPLEHVGYKGSAEALRDVIAGHVPLFSDVLVPTATAIRAGKLRGLAVATTERVGAAARRADGRRGGPARHRRHHAVRHLGARPARRATVVTRLNAAFNEALADPAMRAQAARARLRPGRRHARRPTPQVLATEIAKWRKVIKDSNIPAPT